MTDTHPDSTPQADTPHDDLPKKQKDDHRTESERLDEGLEETFPASDPVAAKHIT